MCITLLLVISLLSVNKINSMERFQQREGFGRSKSWTARTKSMLSPRPKRKDDKKGTQSSPSSPREEENKDKINRGVPPLQSSSSAQSLLPSITLNIGSDHPLLLSPRSSKELECESSPDIASELKALNNQFLEIKRNQSNLINDIMVLVNCMHMFSRCLDRQSYEISLILQACGISPSEEDAVTSTAPTSEETSTDTGELANTLEQFLAKIKEGREKKKGQLEPSAIRFSSRQK